MSIILSKPIIDFANRSGGATLKRSVNAVTGDITYDHTDYEEGYYVAVESIVELPGGAYDALADLADFQCPEDIRKFPEECFLGLWFDDETGNWSVDVVVHTYDLTLATETGIRYKQKAIFDIAEDGIITL